MMKTIRVKAGAAALVVLTGWTAGADAQARTDRTFYALARDTVAQWRPHHRGSIAFVLPEKDLLAENLAYDPRDRSFYVGSTRHGKVVRRTAGGEVADFIPTGRDGLWMVIGLKVDPRRPWLWVNTTGGSNYTGHQPAHGGRAALVRYDLSSGRLLQRFETRDTGAHFFNDLVIAPDGAVFLTDMTAGAIRVLRPGADSLERWVGPAALSFPNGIALSGDARTLYVASREGLTAFDVQSRRMQRLALADSAIDVRGIDGLYWHDGALIGVQGGARNRVQRFELDAAGTRVTRAIVLEANHPMFMNPTTGVVVGDDIYVIANSQFSSFQQDGTLFPPERLFETVVLRIPLR